MQEKRQDDRIIVERIGKGETMSLRINQSFVCTECEQEVYACEGCGEAYRTEQDDCFCDDGERHMHKKCFDIIEAPDDVSILQGQVK